MKKLLLVEDDLFIGDMVETKLTQAGFEVVRVSDGNYVLSKLKETNFDLVLLDLDLPHKGGFEILEEMRKDATLAMVPVVILSNQDAKDVEEKARFLSASFYMKAMTDIDELERIINEKLS